MGPSEECTNRRRYWNVDTWQQQSSNATAEWPVWQNAVHRGGLTEVTWEAARTYAAAETLGARHHAVLMGRRFATDGHFQSNQLPRLLTTSPTV